MLELRDISKTYASGQVGLETCALRGVDLTIHDGEFVAIMGPSGSGKSTLMHILGALDRPTSGAYLLDGRDVSQLSADELAVIRNQKIGFVFQSFNLLPRATVLRNVMIPLVYAGVIPEKREALARIALTNAGFDESHFTHRSNQLSGGQIQRVAIARALVNDPTIILADEPTGNLDTRTGAIVLNTFQWLNEHEGRTIILITHEHDIAEHARRVVTLRDGAIVSDVVNRQPRKATV
ncbi:MAG TPA: ABC transporter ATP-binding protein [Candidatus Paceibacterota bacterium]|nr:ABC transporter ATP-binding protein [Candidatus Paceibacterota bacterium]